MRKLKKVAALALSGAMLISLLAGCGAKNETKKEEASTEALVNQVEEADVPQLDGYSLLWHDEFNGTTLDETIWNKELRDPGWTNNELQEYTSSEDNIFVKDGNLTLKAIKTTDENGNDYYTSGKVQTQNKKDFLYGKVVVRAKAPEGQGLWPAAWMMPTDESLYGQWPKCGEIDIMEVLGNQTDLAYCTLHYGEPHGEQQGTKQLTGTSFSEDFHDYSIEWEPGEIRWYIDDELILTANDWFTAVEGEADKPYPAPFDQTFFVQLNLAVGGSWPGNPDETTDFDKAEYLIDYVRVYQKAEYDTNVTKPVAEFRQPLEDGNLVYNGDFADAEALDDEENWFFLLFADGQGEASIADNTMTITSSAEGTEEYSVQLVQPEMPIYTGHTYVLTFDAAASEERQMKVCVSAPNVGWIRYLEDTKVELGTDYQTYTYEFTVLTKDDNYGRLEFNMGAQGSTADVYIKNVRLEDTTGK